MNRTRQKKEPDTLHSGRIPERRWLLRIDGLPDTQNKFISGKLKDRIGRKKAWRDRVFYAVREQAGVGRFIDPDWYPVRIQVRCGFGPGQRIYDPGNLSAAEKIATDQLVKMGILKGDSSRYVRTVTTGPCFRAKEGFTEYLITPGNYTE